MGKLLGFDKAMKTSIGCAIFQVGYLQVGAIVAVNSCGDIFYPHSQISIATIYDYQKKQRVITVDTFIQMSENMIKSCDMNTTIDCIITNANLTKTQMKKLQVYHVTHRHIV